MSPSWRPDDSFLEREGRDFKGATRVRNALKKAGVRGGRQILTSRDKGIAETRDDLKRTRAPKGFQQWQLPVVLGRDRDIMVFKTVAAPDAVLPAHSHKVDLFRVVISGSAFYRGQELTAGDWMFVPSGATYELTAGPGGFIILHGYCLTGPVKSVRPARPVRNK
jgi:quercetin dioxygenase-like cupin family protein